MRRKEKEIKNRKIIDEIIHKSKVCRLALSENNTPYIIPLCFSYDHSRLFFHSFHSGKKIDIIRKNNKVCFEFDIDCELVAAEDACSWGMKYKSVIGIGRATLVTDMEGKKKALDIIMQQYSDESGFCYSDRSLKEVTVIRVDIKNITAKKSE
jgi:nitroimidazol reductase NimA-like FMN-containing flavoprotein (pyridoxamine 5'-phosphate oxidase superfamily)